MLEIKIIRDDKNNNNHERPQKKFAFDKLYSTFLQDQKKVKKYMIFMYF